MKKMLNQLKKSLMASRRLKGSRKGRKEKLAKAAESI